MPAAAQPSRLVVDGDRRYRLAMLEVGLACCAVEVVAAGLWRGSATDVGGGSAAGLPGGPAEAPNGSELNVLVVAGTVTDAMAPAVLRLWEQLPEPRRVLSFGACSNTGGPYWDSYSVTKGVDQLVPVDVYVPGCPPRPAALLHALRTLTAEPSP